jgi:hypothetical protein
MREIGGVLYCNDGDWVESLSALVEHMDGRLELVYWHQVTGEFASLPPAVAVSPSPVLA